MGTLTRTCDLCLEREEVFDTLLHALGHCSGGEHCCFTTASCAMDVRMHDHANRCCICKMPLFAADGTRLEIEKCQDELAEFMSTVSTMFTALDLLPGEIRLAMLKALQRDSELRIENSPSFSFASG